MPTAAGSASTPTWPRPSQNPSASPPEFVEIDWDNKILELDSKTIDCVWNGMTLTAEVTSTMECSNAYCNNAQVVIVPADKASEYQTVESVKDLTFAAEAGSAGEAELTALGYTVTPSRPSPTR